MFFRFEGGSYFGNIDLKLLHQRVSMKEPQMWNWTCLLAERLRFYHCIWLSQEVMLASVLCFPFVASRGNQLLLKEELSSVRFFRGVTWGSCKVASVPSKDSVWGFQSFLKFTKNKDTKTVFVESSGIQLLLKKELSSMRIFRRVTWGSRKVTSMSLGTPTPFSNSQRTLQNN